MSRKFKFKLLSAALCALMVSFNAFAAHAAAPSLQEKYSKGISVGLTSLKNINNLDFTVTGNYYIKEKPDILLSKNFQYNVTLSGSVFKLYKNGTQIAALDKITICPKESGSYVKFIKDTWLRYFPGSIAFLKQNSSAFIPVNILGIEDYVKGVVPYESSESYPLEALKVQAVAARTYALANLGRFAASGYDLTDDTSCQLYRGYNSAWTKCNKAVDATAGEVLTYKGSLITAYFCSSNGGYTEDSGNVWNSSLPYLKSKQDTYDSCSWKAVFTADEIEQALKSGNYIGKTDIFTGIDVDGIANLKSGRIRKMELNYTDKDGNEQPPVVLTKEKARTAFKSPSWPNGLKSALYTVSFDEDSNTYTFDGKGYGHGVGMSQTGCLNRANAGQDYKKILAFYYDGTEIAKLDPAPESIPDPSDEEDSEGSSSDSGSRGDIPIVQTGWVSMNGNMYYFDANGKPVKNKWVPDQKNRWTYLGTDGAMVKNTWAQDSSKRWFYLGADGAMLQGTSVKDSSKRSFYLDWDGAMVTNRWIYDSGNWFYYGADGAMVKNTWAKDSSKRWFYLGADGAMLVNTVVDGYKIDGFGVSTKPVS